MKSQKRGSRKRAVRTASVIPVVSGVKPPETTTMTRTEAELDIRYPGDVKDADGWPLVAGCWVTARQPSRVCPGFFHEFTGAVIRVVRVEHGRDHGKVLVYARTDDGGREGNCAHIEFVRVRRKPAGALSDELRSL